MQIPFTAAADYQGDPPLSPHLTAALFPHVILLKDVGFNPKSDCVLCQPAQNMHRKKSTGATNKQRVSGCSYCGWCRAFGGAYVPS